MRLDVVLPGLSGEHTFCLITVSFALAIFLVGVLYGDFFIHEILTVHVRDRVVGSFERCKGDETVAF